MPEELIENNMKEEKTLLEKLLENKTVGNWLKVITDRPRTRRLYAYHLLGYTRYLKMTPEELIAEAEAEAKQGVKTRESKLNQHLIDYKFMMETSQFAPKTIKSRMTAIHSFYKYHDVPLPLKIKKEKRAMPLEENQEMPEKEDLQEVLRHCDELERCIVLLGASAGLGEQEISRLKYRDFEKGYDEETQVTTLRLRRIKSGYNFVTYLNPEATRAVLEYIALRKRDTKSHNKYRTAQLEKQRLTPNSYLLIKRKVPNEYLETHDEELRRVTEDAITEIYNLLAEKAGKSTPKGQWGFIRSHNVRKYFSNTLYSTNLEKKKIDFWLGHTQSDSDTAYFHSIAKTGLKDEYIKNMACLYLAEGIDLENDPMVKDLKEKNEGFKRIVEDTSYEMKTTRKKLESTEQKVEAYEQKLKEAEENLKKAQQEAEQKLKEAQEEAHHEWMAVQADKELEMKAMAHERELERESENKAREQEMTAMKQQVDSLMQIMMKMMPPEDKKTLAEIKRDLQE
jgi:integrase